MNTQRDAGLNNSVMKIDSKSFHLVYKIQLQFPDRICVIYGSYQLEQTNHLR